MGTRMEQQNENILVETKDQSNIGSIRIADDVVSAIASIAAQEVEGVASMADTGLNLMGSRKGRRGVKLEIEEDVVHLTLSVQLKYGYNIPATSSSIQTRVKTAIENMTGLTCEDVNIRISGIEM